MVFGCVPRVWVSSQTVFAWNVSQLSTAFCRPMKFYPLIVHHCCIWISNWQQRDMNLITDVFVFYFGPHFDQRRFGTGPSSHQYLRDVTFFGGVIDDDDTRCIVCLGVESFGDKWARATWYQYKFVRVIDVVQRSRCFGTTIVVVPHDLNFIVGVGFGTEQGGAAGDRDGSFRLVDGGGLSCVIV